MRRWRQPARALPVTLRPVGGETVNSYAQALARLAALSAVPARQAGQFYRRVSARLGEGAYQAPADDPVIAWARHHRSSRAGG